MLHRKNKTHIIIHLFFNNYSLITSLTVPACIFTPSIPHDLIQDYLQKTKQNETLFKYCYDDQKTEKVTGAIFI